VRRPQATGSDLRHPVIAHPAGGQSPGRRPRPAPARRNITSYAWSMQAPVVPTAALRTRGVAGSWPAGWHRRGRQHRTGPQRGAAPGTRVARDRAPGRPGSPLSPRKGGRAGDAITTASAPARVAGPVRPSTKNPPVRGYVWAGGPVGMPGRRLG
jgi:hypothetical protein